MLVYIRSHKEKNWKMASVKFLMIIDKIQYWTEIYVQSQMTDRICVTFRFNLHLQQSGNSIKQLLQSIAKSAQRFCIRKELQIAYVLPSPFFNYSIFLQKRPNASMSNFHKNGWMFHKLPLRYDLSQPDLITNQVIDSSASKQLPKNITGPGYKNPIKPQN